MATAYDPKGCAAKNRSKKLEEEKIRMDERNASTTKISPNAAAPPCHSKIVLTPLACDQNRRKTL